MPPAGHLSHHSFHHSSILLFASMSFGGAGGDWKVPETPPGIRFNSRTMRNWAAANRPSPYSALSRRITRMGKRLKMSNPTHLFVWGGSANWSPSNSGTVVDLASMIAQGDCDSA